MYKIVKAEDKVKTKDEYLVDFENALDNAIIHQLQGCKYSIQTKTSYICSVIFTMQCFAYANQSKSFQISFSDLAPIANKMIKKRDELMKNFGKDETVYEGDDILFINGEFR